jgi:transcriptional regulator with PAS, ATPase and Fis domain
VLQEQEVEPLGSDKVVKVNVRVIAATSRDLGAMVADGRFRADLYYRLNVLPIRLPALRERRGDLEALAEALLDDISQRSGLPHKTLTVDALERLAAHDWPGNIRELRNTLEQAALMTDDLTLTAGHLGGLPVAARAETAQHTSAAAQTPSPLTEQRVQLELDAIRKALQASAGNRVAAAKLLGIGRATLYEKLARYPELALAHPAR